jgi:hypothetical protein
MAGLHFHLRENVMTLKNTMTLVGALSLGLSFQTFAATTDTLDSASPGPGSTYWTPSDAQKTSSPYYRWNGQDWGWQHNAIAGTITTASLNISAYDVDAPSENDEIYAYNNDSASWDLLGSLSGASNIWSFTSFNLGASWFDEIALGLQVKMIIDADNNSWAVSLAKSSLSVDGGTIPNPNPNAVPIPAAALLFGPALLGFVGLRRKIKPTVA